ncbi:DUF2510 domain-containing protein [Arthrobacter sp. zg-Y820]|uniref:DUF2510 domain-containing protein n=1 Tax=unclassified Arthrobacter TaxID=235627 RepID=UPI001E318BB4|nr:MULTISPECIES: DUF2510 domain-containing protein [unclassified Arthrobacter]MCC9197837.1 DUF2510 domain-containing protein [Arthrobacter sp. zg-Y820]MDK1280704.1 DUF2510 domain-containing protein [Arthrobacter sp. zg.Y820]WIB10664.1 DUF2510 domain-containing protein [Arthrobacter sp. zg-Y820]
MTSPLPGWYQDPLNPDQLKWWDGQQWSAHTMPLPAADTADSFSPVQPAAPTAREDQSPEAFDVPAAAEDVPSYPGSQGYPGGQQQAFPPYSGYPGQQSGHPGQAQGYTDQAGHVGYQNYQQGYAGSRPAYSGYPGYQGFPGYPARTRSNPVALTGFILGIVSLFLFFIPFVGTAVGLAAGAFSAIGLSNQSDRAPMYKVFGVIGLVLGIIFTLLSVLVLFVFLSSSLYY